MEYIGCRVITTGYPRYVDGTKPIDYYIGKHGVVVSFSEEASNGALSEKASNTFLYTVKLDDGMMVTYKKEALFFTK